MATIHDISKKAGVSPATVSLVLNNKAGVSPETIIKVKEIAKAFSYAPQNNRVKKTMTGTIGFARMIMHGHVLNHNHQAFIADYLDGLEFESSIRGYRTEVLTFNKEHPQKVIEKLQRHNLVGAVILATEMSTADVMAFLPSPLPLVFMDACYDILPFDFVDMNNIGAVNQLIAYLVKCGHSEIGFLKGSYEAQNSLARWNAFEQAMRSRHMKIKKQHLYTIDFVFENACRELKNIFSSPTIKLPDAIFCVNDILALATIRSLQDCGYKVPQDISVIGFDNLISAELSSPSLSSYEVSKKTIGKKASELLIERINNPTKPVEKVRIDGRLVKRKSVLCKNNNIE